MNAAWIIVAVVVIVAIVAMSKRHKPKAANDVGKSGWWIQFSPGMPQHPTPDGAGWHCAVPAPPGQLEYVQNFSSPAIRAGQTLTAKFTITGGGFTAPDDPGRIAVVSLLLQRHGDNWTAQGVMASYRFYSSATFPLAAGDGVLTMSIDPAQWTNVNGQHDAAGFAAMLAELSNAGLVFGSSNLRGHGVSASQPSTFRLVSLEAA